MKNVLIVDDSEMVRRVIREVLTKNGFNIVGEAENGRLGVEKYIELKPDIVTMDITLEEMNGIDALKEIKKIEPSAVVVIVSSTVYQSFVAAEIVQSGADDCVVKPFDEEMLMKIMGKYK
jgi:two-component system chemotaxis response regulator CheY